MSQQSHLTPSHIEIMNALIPKEKPEPTIPISEMFDFMRWTHEECYSYIQSLMSFKDDCWGDQLFTASDLWNRYQEYKQKVKQETNDKV